MSNPTNSTAKQIEPISNQPAAEQFETILTHKAAYTPPVLTTYGSVSELTTFGGGSDLDGVGGDIVPSDRRVKENLVRVGQHPLGIGLYLFDYKPEFRKQWGASRQFGVMADEVEAVMPAAVTTHADGYKLVNYRMLGITRTIH
jgi:hypothetical protein